MEWEQNEAQTIEALQRRIQELERRNAEKVTPTPSTTVTTEVSNALLIPTPNLSSGRVYPSSHPLRSTWVLWMHLQNDPDWSIRSYVKMATFSTLEECIAITELLPDAFKTSSMLFLMRENIAPRYEDQRNIHGGGLSYQVDLCNVASAWSDLTYSLVGETLTSNDSPIAKSITGITISPKKRFCVVKIWLATCKEQDPALITAKMRHLSASGCMFLKHPVNK